MIEQANRAVSLAPIQEADFAAVAALARAIWLAHYTTIISRNQIEYMLTGRFTSEQLCRYVASSERWMEVLRVDGELVGYCSYALTSTPGEMKLEQLYLSPALHGRGLGRLMLEHIERSSMQHGCRMLMLQVNKRNETAIQVYHRAGFIVREDVIVDIGHGFVMDDYVMEKRLPS